MKVLSLFSGVGGFDLGLERAGMQTVFQCEWDKHATRILERHWPDVPRWDDVSTLTGKHILAHAPVIDVVAWGSPCQDLSVAGKRAGLDGSRSGLFHEGIRIIKELQEETNGKYPRISLWENVYGALSSNKGADFGVILDEMAEAGALVQEWRVLDAQYFGVPQRRRRVFLVSIFDPATAARCANPLLPVSESVCRDIEAGGTERQEPTGTVEQSLASGRDIANTISAELCHKSTVVNQDVNNGHLIVGSLAARDYKGVGNQYVNEGKPVVEPFTGSSHAQYTEGVGTLRANGGDLAGGSETLLVEPLANTKAEEPIVFENSRRDSARIAEDGVTQTLSAHMGTGGGNTPMVALGIQGNVIGRQDHNGPSGKGHTEEGDPMFTLTGTDIHAVAYTLREREGKAGGGKGPLYGEEKSHSLIASNDQKLFVDAVAYDEYNDTLGGDIHHALRAGTKQSTGVIEPTMAVRRLTPIECERLMGWPDGWTEGQADTHRYKQCGNGVASPVATWIGQQLINL